MKATITTCWSAALIITITNSLLGQSPKTNIVGGSKPSISQRVGGFLIDYKSAKGEYVFINCQSRIDIRLIKGMSIGLMNDFNWIISIQEGDKSIISIEDAIGQKNKYNALAGTLFIDSDTLPVMTIVPESNLAIINVKELTIDSSKKILVDNRLIRESLRAFAFSLGAGYSTFENGVMQPILSASELDRFSSNFLSPDTANAILQNGLKIGFKPYRRTTYKRACKEGWAPAPTNEFQKAIWDKVHAAPKNPIKIEFDPKKGR